MRISRLLKIYGNTGFQPVCPSGLRPDAKGKHQADAQPRNEPAKRILSRAQPRWPGCFFNYLLWIAISAAAVCGLQAATFEKTLVLKPSDRNPPPFVVELPPKASAMLTVKVQKEETIGLVKYTLKLGSVQPDIAPPGNPNVIWTHPPPTVTADFVEFVFSVVNVAPAANAATTVKVPCEWEAPKPTSSGGGTKPADISGLATGIAKLAKTGNCAWSFDREYQLADGTSPIKWELKFVNEDGNLPMINFTKIEAVILEPAAPATATWTVAPNTNAVSPVAGTITSHDGSLGNLKATYVEEGVIKSNEALTRLRFLPIEVVQPKIKTTSDLRGNTTEGDIEKDVNGKDVLVPVSAVRFCRWTSAFPGGSFDQNFYKTDRDRFQIRVHGDITGLTKIRVSSLYFVKTVAGGQYLEKPNGDGTIEVAMHKENGDMLSDPVLLVSDADDDIQFNGSGTDNGKDDATLQASFDSRIKVEFPEFNNTSKEFNAVKPMGRIKVNIAYCSLDGTLPQDKRDLIVLQVLKAKDAYRQISIDLFVANIWAYKLPNEPGYEFETFLGTKKELNGVVSGKLAYCLRTQTQKPIPADQILVGFIDAALTSPPSIESPFGVSVHGFSENYSSPAIISLKSAPRGKGSDRQHFTLAHEVGHLVTKAGHPDSDPPERLMVDGFKSRYEFNHKDSKRFTLSEIERIKTIKTIFYAPLQ